MGLNLRGRRLAAAAALTAIGTLACIYWMGGLARSEATRSRKIACYQDSMHPWIKSPSPGKCTICAMDLTPIYEGDDGFAAEEGVVVLNSNSITVLNVQTEEVRRRPLALTLRVAGTIDADETKKVIFSAPATGRIHEMLLGAVGDEVHAAKPLLTFYSPELATWRKAYVVRGRTGTAATPLFAGRPHEPAGEERGRAGAHTVEPDPYFSDLLSPISGTIVERNVYSGQYVAEGDRMMTIVDTSVLWFRFDAYEHQLPWLSKGQPLRVRVAGLPGREFSGVISVIEPTIDPATRTVKVRADLANPVVEQGGHQVRLLRLGMYAEALVPAELPDVLTVPRAAVLSPGGRTYAYVDQNAGAYAIRPVKLGRQGDGLCEVLEGLDEGDRVVTTGNVLIDAQAQLTQPAAFEALQMAAKPAREHTAQPQAGPASASLAPSQLKHLEALVANAGLISASLAADNLAETRQAAARLKSIMPELVADFGATSPWHAAIQALAAHSAWPEAKDLDDARKVFLPFSTSMVALVERLRSERTEFESLKVYHCPMAPKPGLWFQTKGPLRNPYYGAEMLICGKEVPRRAEPKVMAAPAEPAPMLAGRPARHEHAESPETHSPAAEPGEAPPPEPGSGHGTLPNAASMDHRSMESHVGASPESPVQPAPLPGDVVQTMKTRHPEAKERMARSFALGVAERHRAAANTKSSEPQP